MAAQARPEVPLTGSRPDACRDSRPAVVAAYPMRRTPLMRPLGSVLLALGVLLGVGVGIGLLLGVQLPGVPWIVAVGFAKLTLIASGG